MYVRLWFQGGAIADRPMRDEWDGMPFAEYQAPRPVVVDTYEVHADDGTPLALPETVNAMLDAGDSFAVRVDGALSIMFAWPGWIDNDDWIPA